MFGRLLLPLNNFDILNISQTDEVHRKSVAGSEEEVCLESQSQLRKADEPLKA